MLFVLLLALPTPLRPGPTFDYARLVPGTTACDLARFPPKDAALKALNASYVYREHQWGKRRMGPVACIVYAEEMANAEWRHRCWDLLTDAQIYQARGLKIEARELLERLREEIGKEWFRRGLMPPPAPDWFHPPVVPAMPPAD